MEELVYTSAPQGLRQGSSGFCTVEMTEGMSPEMMDSLESLSAYDNDPSETINWMHVRFHGERGVRHVMSRVGPLRGEFSGRTNKLAHHICLASGELPSAGPMRVVGPGGPLRQNWSGQVQHLKPKTAPANLRAASIPGVCRRWESDVGDAGVAGAVLARLRQTGSSPLWVIRTPQMNALAMIDEMLALMSGQQRWDVTFCTYLHSLPRSAECRLRWVLTDSPAMQHLQNIGPDQLIDLRNGAESVLRGADDALVHAARSGAAATSTSRPSPASLAFAGTTSGPSRQRGINQVGVRDPQLASTDPIDHELPPPPPAQGATTLRWAIAGAALAIIPVGVMMWFMLSSAPVPVVAIRDSDTQTHSDPPIEVVPKVVPLEQPLTQQAAVEEKLDDKPKQRVPKAKPRTERKTRSLPPQDPPARQPKSETPQTISMRLRLPNPGSFGEDRQTIHQAAGVYDVSLIPVATRSQSVELRLTPPDSLGVRILEKVVEPNDPHTIGRIYTEDDQVLFAWTPSADRADAWAFLITYELLIKDDTHYTTVQFELPESKPLGSPPIPVQQFDIVLPDWFVSKYDCLLKVRFPLHDVEASFVVSLDPESTDEPPWVPKRVDISSLGDPLIHEAILSSRAHAITAGKGRKIVFASKLDFRGNGQVFSLAQLHRVIDEQTQKFNRSEKNRMSSRARKKLFDSWRRSLCCELEIYVRVDGRNILWRKSGGQTE